MSHPNRRHLLALPWLAACAPVSGPPPDAFPPPLQGLREPLDAEQSRLRILVFRGGAAARLGHNHVLLAGDLAGDLFWLDPIQRSERRFSSAGLNLTFTLPALRLDPEAERLALGAGFESVLSDEDRAGTRANLLRALDAEHYPRVRLQTLRTVGEGDRFAVEVAIELHGQVRRQWLAITVQGGRAHGQLVIRQSDFGIRPFSVLGGLLAVRDELWVEVDLAA